MNTLVTGLYLAILGVFSLHGLHRLWLVWHHRLPAPPSPDEPDVWPRVVVQLPLFNEPTVAARVIAASGALDYPDLAIQVLDDSTDETTQIARAAVEALRARGIDAELRHRDDRTGFKAGALEAGMAATDADLFAVFDADFVPRPDFLRRTVPWMAPDVGMVQARWGHLNPGQSWLTTAQATLLDGHFTVEHAARHRSGRWFNFNGTAGLWRRQAIERAGGWQHDTLTEDLDLSYRAQLAGWRFVYLDDHHAPAEIPATLAAFRSQQHRWARGGIQTLRKLIRLIWSSDAALPLKLEATIHLGANLNYPLLVLLSVVLPPAILVRGAAPLPWFDAVVSVCAIGPFIAYYAAAVVRSSDARRRLLSLPVVFALGIGMAVAQSRAVVQGLLGPVGTFVRTPKNGFRLSPPTLPPTFAFELALALYLWISVGLVAASGRWGALPFLTLFAVGYALVVFQTVREQRGTPRHEGQPGGLVP